MIDHIDANVRLHEQQQRIRQHDGTRGDTEVFSVFVFDTRTAPNRRSAVVETRIDAPIEIGPGWWERARANITEARVFGISLRRREPTPT